MQTLTTINKLLSYIPANSFLYIRELHTEYNFNLKITRPRITKLGDYRAPDRNQGHRISINNDLNKYAFLITLVHEIAHLAAWNKYKNKIDAHGKEWKEEYKNLISPLMNPEIFPDEILTALNRYLKNPAAASCTDLNLLRTLRRHDGDEEYMHLEDLPEGSNFILKGGRKFTKGPLLRKRYKCVESGTGLTYRVSPLAQVQAADLQMKIFA